MKLARGNKAYWDLNAGTQKNNHHTAQPSGWLPPLAPPLPPAPVVLSPRGHVLHRTSGNVWRHLGLSQGGGRRRDVTGI